MIYNITDPKVLSLLRSGAVGVLPTDTVYGLACQATNKTAVAKLYALKNRENKPGTVIAADVNQLIELGVKPRYLKAVESYWPNPISVEIPLDDNLRELHNGKYTAAFRIPKDVGLCEFLKHTGPLLTTSANYPGEPIAVCIEQALAYFNGNVDFYVDGGDLSDRKPSTVIRIVDDAIEVLREGAIKVDLGA